MLFTSFTFLIFFIPVFILYWVAVHRNLLIQNLFLLACSYFFYGWWDWKVLFYLFFISGSNFVIAILIQKAYLLSFKKPIFVTGLILNIGSLVYFKYFNFFIKEISELISLFGFDPHISTLNIILPIGISFYIFLSLSYIVDVYQNKMIAEKNIINALLTLSFFPIILAGPIHRPISLLPQIKTRRIFDYSHMTDGLRQVLWGVFMKVVISDNCAADNDIIFKNFSDFSGSTLILGLILFTVQIYADFAGYSNIAIGVGKLLGFNIMQNFAYPYFAKNIKEFWQRWNISLTHWFRDYVFLPTAYYISRKIKKERILHVKSDYIIYAIGIFFTWMLTGLWHGANVTFIIWGLIHGFFLLLNHILNKPRKKILKRLRIQNNNGILVIIDSNLTMFIVMFSWIFFRAESINHSFAYINGIFTSSLFTLPEIRQSTTLVFVLLFFIIEYLGRKQEYAISRFGAQWPRIIRWLFYYAIILSIIYYLRSNQQFIYFQF